MRNILTIVCLFIVISCKESKTDNPNSDNGITRALENNSDAIKPNMITELKATESTEKESISIDLIFRKNSIVEPTHQKVYLSFLLTQTKELQNYREITFNYHIENEEFNKSSFLISQKTKESILKKFSFIPFRNYTKYCLKNFEVGTIYALDIWIDNINQIYPDELMKTNFFDVIEKFSYECSDMDKSKDAKATLVVLYVAIKDYVDKVKPENPQLSSQKHNQKFLEELWKICNNGEMIQFAEQRLFGKVGGNWDEYSKYNSQN
ncbi:hypothetical protein KO504_12770 [Winogradskyella psychrotolerans]|uniref:hypothetical protein n=1 Tax=Winogradskyella psychrotolerans TaxID=1344585 RepID=UPI001C06D5FA|nr:hypothetical protein [Winogradskyella psychrotolerans]MBU2922219.1 hypothetical protein [Winogradskyella psychrotolerans]